MGRVALVGQLDEDGTTVRRVLPPVDEPALLEPVEVARQRRALDPDGAGEVVLGAPRRRLQVRQHEPGRNRAACLGQRAVEGAANRLGRLEEPEPERGRGGAHHAHPIANASHLIIRVLIMCRRTIRAKGETTMSALPLMHESWGALAVARPALDPALDRRDRHRDPPGRAAWRLVVRAAGRLRPRAAGDPGRPLRPGRDRRHRVPVQAGHTPSVV